MVSTKLPNYLRSYRKRLALSEEEMAFLLGLRTIATISRYEAFLRKPRLGQVLGYMIIFKKSLNEIFAGEFVKIQHEIAVRARVLLSRRANQKPGPRIAHKRKALGDLVSEPAL